MAEAGSYLCIQLYSKFQLILFILHSYWLILGF